MPYVFKMPPLNIGDFVVWHQDCDKGLAPTPALVQECSQCNCTLRLFNRTEINTVKYDVLHIDDPRCENPNRRENGAWSYHPQTLKVHELEEKFAKLEQEFELMQDVVTSKAT